MYDMSRGELRYTKEKGYYYENEVDEISYIKVLITIFIFLIVSLGVYKYESLMDIFKTSPSLVVKTDIIEKNIIKTENSIIKEKVALEEPIKEKIEEVKSSEVNITVETELKDEEDVVFFTSMGKTVDNSKMQDLYQEPKKDKNTTVIK